MVEASWHPLVEALDHAAEAGRTVEFWLRDDDAVAPTAALARLTTVCETHDVPVLLAVIPEPAAEGLAEHVAEHPLLKPAQHGYRHANHAAHGERPREMGGKRTLDLVFSELAVGQGKIRRLFGASAARILVPPWNRIDADVLRDLPLHGFDVLSGFGPVSEPVRNLRQVNCDLDIIDWRHGRIGRPHAQLFARLSELIVGRMDDARPIGLLTHHLVHDHTAWSFLEQSLTCLREHPAAVFRPPAGYG